MVMPAGGWIWDRLERMADRTVLAEGDGRKVVRYADEPDDDEEDAAVIIAKYYSDGRGANTVRIMDLVCGALDASTTKPLLSTPRALGYFEDRHLLLQQPARGVRFDTLLSGSDAPDALHLAGRALASLHALDVQIGPPAHMPHHLRDLVRPHPRALADAVPEVAGAVGRVLQLLVEADTLSDRGRRDSLIHRDIHPKQLFRDGYRVCLIDWDLATRGDAALDVGNFVAYLRARRGMDEDAIDAFLGGYRVSGNADVLERVHVYEAFTYLRLACKRFRLGEDGWRDECGRLIARAEHTLASV